MTDVERKPVVLPNLPSATTVDALRKLRDEARREGNDTLAERCNEALMGQPEALSECKAVIKRKGWA